jgi:hypothetical protein
MIDFTIEQLDEVLVHDNIKNIPLMTARPEEFLRDRAFEIDGERYTIEWWTNICYLTVGEVLIPFRYVVKHGTWPNGKKLNLQFYNDQRQVCCVIPLE